jgi:hypothetical protein
MRAVRSIALVSLFAVLAGCAASPDRVVVSQSTYYDDVDWVKMTRITREAEMRGYKVWWVHPPQKSPAQRAAADEGTAP